MNKRLFYLISVAALLIAFSCCTAKKDISLPRDQSESITRKAFETDTEILGYAYEKEVVELPPGKRNIDWAITLLGDKAHVRDLRFLTYSGFEIGMDGKTDNYAISGYSDSIERVLYMFVNGEEGVLYEVKRPTDDIHSLFTSSSMITDQEVLVSQAVAKYGECPEGLIIEINSSKARATIGCPGRWKDSNVQYIKVAGKSPKKVVVEED